MCVPSVSAHTYVSFPEGYEDDCSKKMSIYRQEGE